MGLVSFLVAVVAGAAFAGGVGVLVVSQNHPDKAVIEQEEARKENNLPPLSEPVVLDYGSR